MSNRIRTLYIVHSQMSSHDTDTYRHVNIVINILKYCSNVTQPVGN